MNDQEKRELQLKRLKRLLEAIEHNLTSFDMRYYYKDLTGSDPECGTVSCIAGFTINLFTKFRFFDNYTLIYNHCHASFSVPFEREHASRLLGLTDTFSRALFLLHDFESEELKWEVIGTTCDGNDKKAIQIREIGITRLKQTIQSIENQNTSGICDYDDMITGCLVQYKLDKFKRHLTENYGS